MIDEKDNASKNSETPGSSEVLFDNILRPSKMKDYVGQRDIVQNLEIALKATAKRSEPLDHILLYGPPGLGKTTLANIIATEMGSRLRITSGPALEKQGDILSILTNLEQSDVLFIDEIHRLKPQIEELLYSAMEDYCVDIMIGKGPSARSMRLSLPKFTLIGATTKLSMIANPLYDRFGNVFRLSFYSIDEITTILHRSSNILGVKLDEQSALQIAKASRCTPRIANRLLKRVRDFASIDNVTDITAEIAQKSLKLLGLDEIGLNNHDREILEIINSKFRGGPVGLSTLSAATSEDASTIEDIYEPYLMQLGFLERTPKGRCITDAGKKYVLRDTITYSLF